MTRAIAYARQAAQSLKTCPPQKCCCLTPSQMSFVISAICAVAALTCFGLGAHEGAGLTFAGLSAGALVLALYLRYRKPAAIPTRIDPPPAASSPASSAVATPSPAAPLPPPSDAKNESDTTHASDGEAEDEFGEARLEEPITNPNDLKKIVEEAIKNANRPVFNRFITAIQKAVVDDEIDASEAVTIVPKDGPIRAQLLAALGEPGGEK